eukprot:scaffold293764_cov30-Tisochrysis_lutea.AAC.8
MARRGGESGVRPREETAASAESSHPKAAPRDDVRPCQSPPVTDNAGELVADDVPSPLAPAR